jgi:pyruvate formate lyase activating enzyme
MDELTRRDVLRAAGLGACGLGATWLGMRAHALTRPDLPSTAVDTLTDLGPHAREARFYSGAGSGATELNCEACHSGIQPPSRVGYCHTEHPPGHVKCELCPHGCVISEGHRGQCRVRENRNGKLYTLVYGNPCAAHIDPIEKKPLFHFYPTTRALSIATAGCNLTCLYCQNWTISQAHPEDVEVTDWPPEQVAELAVANRCPVIAYTYSEPTVFYEYMVDTAAVGRQSGIKSAVISAGYISPEPLRALCQVVDAVKIDLKGFNEDFYRQVCGAELEGVLGAIETIHNQGVHLEIVNLVVPTLNDKTDELRALADWVVQTVGPDVPLHFSRFHPQYKLTNLPATPLEKLNEARDAALAAGCRFVYLGNVPGHPGSNTYCPRCGELLIGRLGFWVQEYHLTEGACGYCGEPIAGEWGAVELDYQSPPLAPPSGPADS